MPYTAIEPFSALREQFSSKPGGPTSTWQPCRVIAITTDDEGEPAYVVESRSAAGIIALTVESYLRKATQ